jgi:serine/threonine protein kinase
MWAVGVTLHYLLGGIHPFYHDDQEVTNRKITRAYFDFSSPYWNHVTSLAKELIRNLLVKSADDRFTVDATLAHKWMDVDLPENQNALNVDFFNRNLDNMGKYKVLMIYFLPVFICLRCPSHRSCPCLLPILSIPTLPYRFSCS